MAIKLSFLKWRNPEIRTPVWNKNHRTPLILPSDKPCLKIWKLHFINKDLRDKYFLCDTTKQSLDALI